MQSLDVFMSRLVPKVPGCPDPLIRQVLVDAAIEFCEQSLITQHTCEPVAVVANQGTYTLDVPADQGVVLTLKAWYNTTQLSPVPADRLDSILAFVNAAGDETAAKGTPYLFYELTPGSVGLYPIPKDDAPLAFSARIATKPLRSATTLEDVLYEDWCEAIVAGAAFRLHSMQGQPFSDPQSAGIERVAFFNAASMASNVAMRGRVTASRSVHPRAFA